MTFVVGLTGGIGSGKSAVADRFQALGIEIVDADIAARVVVDAGRPSLDLIREHFGDDILTADGRLDRRALRVRVFADEKERRWLESLLHPLIGEQIATDLEAARSPYAILVSPLLIESSQTRHAHRILVVDAPESAQIERTVARDDTDEAQVRSIMAAQATRERRLAAADDVIVNDGGLDALDAEVARLNETYLEMARGHGR